jgi:hypothetical protein
MTEDHIKQIAEKADQLIEIIQNIKDKVGPAKTAPPVEQPNADLEESNHEGGWWA